MDATLERRHTARSDATRPGDGLVSLPVVAGCLRIGDAIVAAGAALSVAADQGPATGLAKDAVIGTLLAIGCFEAAGVYRPGPLGRPTSQLARLGLSWILALLAAQGLATALPGAGRIPASALILWLVVGAAGFAVTRLGLGLALARWRRAGRLRRNLVIVGAGELGQRLVEQLEQRGQDTRLIGVFDDRRDRVPHYLGGYPVLGTIDDLVTFASRHRVDLVVVALPWSAEGRLLACMRKLRNLPVDVRLCPDLVGFHLRGRGVAELAGVPLLAVYDRPLEGWGALIKAIEDKVIAATILLLAGPLMLAVAVAIRLESPGPALYRQKRHGLNNEIIEVLKFRTMYVERCAVGTEADLRQASPGDPRVTRLGRVLRCLSIDELPQLLNVLKGEMSIVGPRPHAVAHNQHYEPLIEGYLARHRVKPGITGWAQINGSRGATLTVETMQRRVELDLHYIRNWSLLLDLRIIAATLLGGFTGRGAY